MPYSTATTAASVGVTMPDRMPPRMMTGIIRATKDCLKFRYSSAREDFSLRGRFLRTATT